MTHPWMQQIEFDPSAERSYDLMRGGFVWSDELPAHRSPDFVPALEYLFKAIAYRASLSLNDPDPEFESSWQKVEREFPTWPGFRSERIYGQVQRDLKAVKLWEKRCYDRLEREELEEEL